MVEISVESKKQAADIVEGIYSSGLIYSPSKNREAIERIIAKGLEVAWSTGIEDQKAIERLNRVFS